VDDTTVGKLCMNVRTFIPDSIEWLLIYLCNR
jgi:hypothetical protein